MESINLEIQQILNSMFMRILHRFQCQSCFSTQIKQTKLSSRILNERYQERTLCLCTMEIACETFHMFSFPYWCWKNILLLTRICEFEVKINSFQCLDYPMAMTFSNSYHYMNHNFKNGIPHWISLFPLVCCDSCNGGGCRWCHWCCICCCCCPWMYAL